MMTLTESEVAIVRKCAEAICSMCANRGKWSTARLEDGDYYHLKLNRFDEAGQWCDSNAIWLEFPQVAEHGA